MTDTQLYISNTENSINSNSFFTKIKIVLAVLNFLFIFIVVFIALNYFNIIRYDNIFPFLGFLPHQYANIANTDNNNNYALFPVWPNQLSKFPQKNKLEETHVYLGVVKNFSNNILTLKNHGWEISFHISAGKRINFLPPPPSGITQSASITDLHVGDEIEIVFTQRVYALPQVIVYKVTQAYFNNLDRYLLR